MPPSRRWWLGLPPTLRTWPIRLNRTTRRQQHGPQRRPSAWLRHSRRPRRCSPLPPASLPRPRKTHAEALAAVTKDDSTYTPLLKARDGREYRPPPGAGKVDHRCEESTHRARRRQPHLDAPLRHSARPDRRQLRAQRQAADAPGTSRLARGGVDADELVDEAPASTDCDFAFLPAQFAERRWGEQDRRPRESVLLAGQSPPHGGRGRPRQSARGRRSTRSNARRARSSTRNSA